MLLFLYREIVIIGIILYLPQLTDQNKRMKIFTLFTALLLAVTSYAQDAKGYYVTASGQRTQGYFKQGDYNDTPALRFKASRGDEYAALPEEVVEYGFDEERLKFVKHTVSMDVSGNDTTDKNPKLESRVIFLNLLLKGKATLYSYTKDYRVTYFFSVEGKQETVNQLVYKKYKLADGSPAENAGFRQQLFETVKCDRQNISDFTGIFYDKKQLMNVIRNYNECTGGKAVAFGPKKQTGFKYTVVGGLYSSRLGIENGKPDVKTTSADINFGLGFEAAYVFKSEATELFFRGEFETINVTLDETADLGYNLTRSIYELETYAANIYIGPRYNFIINDNNKIFADASFCFSIPFGDITKATRITPPTGETYNGTGVTYSLDPGFAVDFGVGYTLNKKFGLALRYETSRDFLDDANGSFKMKLSRLGLNLRYTLN